MSASLPLFDAGEEAAAVEPAEAAAEWLALRQTLQQRWGDRLHLGTSSWHFPG